VEELKSAVRAVCIVSAGVCIAENLFSGTRLKGQIKLLLDLAVITVVIAGFTRGTAQFSLPDLSTYNTDYYGFSRELYISELERQTGENISDILMEQLRSAGIECSEIYTDVNISEDNSITINRVEVRTGDFAGAEEVIRKSIGESAEVVNGSD